MVFLGPFLALICSYMKNATLPVDVEKFITKNGYSFQDLDTKKVFSNSTGLSWFLTLIAIFVGIFLIIGGIFFTALFIVGPVVLLIPLFAYLRRKKFVFDFASETFEINESAFSGKKAKYPFREIRAVEINYFIADGAASAFAESQQEHNYQVFLRAANGKEHELFKIKETGFNPIDKIAAVRYTLSSWLKIKN